MAERTGARADFSPTPALVLAGWSLSWAPAEQAAVSAAVEGRALPWAASRAQAAGYAELEEAMEADGYEPTGTGAAVARAMKEFAEGEGR